MMKKIYMIALTASLLSFAFLPTSKVGAEYNDPYETPRIEISLSYSPQNPVNDPENPIELTVSANVLSQNDSDNVKYTWRVYGSTSKDEPDEADWEEILKKDLEDVSDMSGYGINKLKFKLAFDDDLHFIRVKLNIEEKTDEGRTNTSYKSIVIPINSASTSLSVYSASADNGLKMTDEICNITTQAETCAVTKGEIIGLKLNSSNLTDFSWKVDGSSAAYSAKCSSTDCGSSLKEIYIPILKGSGQSYAIEVSANTKDTGKRVTFNYTLSVSELEALIECVDKTTCAPIIYGYFKDLDGNLTPDYSKNQFEAVAGTTVKLNPNIKVKNISNVTWAIDGTEITKDNASQYGLTIDNKEYGVVVNDDGSISFPSNIEPGYSFDVTFSAIYAPDNATKKALVEYWNADSKNFYEKSIDATINITVVNSLGSPDNSSASSTEKNKNKFLASLASNAPSQLIFLIKIVLLSFLLLFSSYLLLSFFSKKEPNKK